MKKVIVAVMMVMAVSVNVTMASQKGKKSKSDPMFSAPAVVDGSGSILGTLHLYGNILVENGYYIRVSAQDGLLWGASLYYEEEDCQGLPYSRSFYNENSDLVGSVIRIENSLYYTSKSAPYQSIWFKSYTLSEGECHNGRVKTQCYPVYPNDPEITGVPNGIGTKENPYPLPITVERY